MGEFNINKSDGSLEQTAGMPDTYPAEQVMMSDGTTSVEDAIDELNSSKMDSLYFHSVKLNLSNYKVIYNVPTNQGALCASAIVTADAAIALPTAVWSNGTKISVNGYNQNITATQEILLAYFSYKS